MDKFIKKLLVGTLCATMVLGSTVTAFAGEDGGEASTENAITDPENANGSTTGTGALEGHVDKDVFSVVLPTIAEGDTTFSFILDPEELIKATSEQDSKHYADATFGDGTLFFQNATEESSTAYSNTSDALTVKNKSTMAVDIALSATLTDATGLTLSSDSEFKDDTSASIYLALNDGTNTAALTSTGATINATIDAAADGAYETVWNADTSKYEYVLTDATEAEDYSGFGEYEFKVTGACNPSEDVDWSALTALTPKLSITWKVTKHVDSYLDKTEVSASSNVVNATLPSGVTIAGVIVTKTDKSTVDWKANKNATISGGKITFTAAALTANKGCTITVSFSDGHSDTLTIN